jgi:release factor glutamine methyltransferase
VTQRVGAALTAIAGRLRVVGVPTPEVDAALLVAHATGMARGRLRMAADEPIPEEAAQVLEALVRRREAREPVQLLLGSVGFRHLDVLVRPGVFLPRPETETLAGEAIARLEPGGLAVEPCTGTGAVACAVATEARARVIATDRSAAAVALARDNAAATGAEVEVHRGDLLDPVPAELRGRVDVLVSNPPYVAAEELVGLEPEVLDWDPREALVAGATGHELSDRLIAAAGTWLRPGGWLLLEVDTARATATARRCAAVGLTGSGVIRDLAGRHRVVVARRPVP